MWSKKRTKSFDMCNSGFLPLLSVLFVVNEKRWLFLFLLFWAIKTKLARIY